MVDQLSTTARSTLADDSGGTKSTFDCVTDAGVLGTASSLAVSTANTEQATKKLEMFGYPGPVFYTLHSAALASIWISACVSAGVVLFFFWRGGCTAGTVWCRPIGERLVLYLAIADLGYSLTNLMNHAYVLVLKDHPPDDACAVVGAMLQFWIQTQTMVVLFTAVNLCFLVVREVRLNLGRRDWRLLTYALGLPVASVVLGFIFDFWGPARGW